jgi:hypothetical protein
MTYAAGEFDNCQIRGITFHNICFRIEGSKNIKFKYCTFDYGKRTPNTDKNTYNDAYILLTRTDKVLIDHCVFYRRSGNSGRAIWNAYASQTRIINCTIGDGAELGYFVTAINETGTYSTLIQGNTIKRNPMLNSVDAETDHGIYAHTFNGVIIKSNAISGWPTSATGGGIKARNGEHITISRNTLTGSGILLYEYNGTHVPYLKYVVVTHNTIHIPTNATDNYHGIGYWRNNANESEYSIKISHNTLPNGTIRIVGKDVDTANFNAAGGGVFNNDIGTLDLKSGINNSGNF